MSGISLSIPRNAEQIFIKGSQGNLQTLKLNQSGNLRGVAIVFHPDPKAGGTNTNKVVQTIAKSLNLNGYICYCPNLRSAGLSDGIHDFGRGEIDDGLVIYDFVHNNHPHLPIIIGGFSFGSAVASQLAAKEMHDKLILVGAAVTRYEVCVPENNKTIVIHGEIDEVIPLAEIYMWADKHNIPVSVFPQTGHFFHGKLVQLQNYLHQFVSQK